MNIWIFIIGEALVVGLWIFGYWAYLEWDFRKWLKALKKESKDDFIRQCKERGLDWRKYWSEYP